MLPIKYKQFIFKEWLISFIILLIAFITLLTTFFIFINCNCNKIYKLISLLLLICVIISSLFYLIELNKIIEKEEILKFITRFNFIKKIQLSLILLSLIIISKIVSFSSNCQKKEDSSYIHNINIIPKDSLINKEKINDTVIIKEIIHTKYNPIVLPNINLKCKDHLSKNEYIIKLENQDILKDIIDQTKLNTDVIIKNINDLKKDSTSLKSKQNITKNYSFKKIKVNNKKNHLIIIDSLINVDSLKIKEIK